LCQHPLEKARSAIERCTQVLQVILTCVNYPRSPLTG